MRLLSWIACLLALSLPTAAESLQRPPPPVPASPASDLLFATPTRLDQVGRIVVPVMIDGRGPYRFIVDTGASHSTISPQLAGRLGLDSAHQAPIQVNGITGTAREPAARIHLLTAGDLRISNAEFPILWAPLMAGADGILGVAGLTRDCLSVDFQKNQVSISHCGWFRAPLGAEDIPAVRLTGGLVAVYASVGGVRVPAIIDTGSERTLGNVALRNALYPPARPGTAADMTRVYGATNEVSTGEMKIAPTIRLGSVSMSDVAVVFGSFHIFKIWGLDERPAMLIGMDVLGSVDGLGVNFRRPSIYLQTSRYVAPSSLLSGDY